MRARTKSLPAPIGGLNARDGIAAMPPADAVVLDNWFPTPSTVDLRKGCAVYAKGLGAAVETLATYSSAKGTQVFAAAGANIFDVTAGGAVGAPVVTGQASARWQSLNFGSTAANGQFLYLFDGIDYPLVYTGTQWEVVASTSTAQAISAITNSSGTTAVVATSAPHGLMTGNSVIITGAVPAGYNGSFPITVPAAAAGQAISSITRSGTTATLTTAAPHGLASGAFVTISGATPSGFNGTYAITVASSTTFTYTLAADPGANAAPVGSYVIAPTTFSYTLPAAIGTAATTVGSYLVSPAITGVDPRLLVQGISFKQRIYMVEKDSFRCWYLPVNAIGGAAQSLDFGGMFSLGGYLMAVATWSVDNASGLQEFFVAISSQGEVVVYQGYDPTNADNWSIASHFRVGRPLGRRCFTKIGSDLVLLSVDGAYPLSQALLTDRSQESKALSEKIQDLINTDAQLYSDNFGWQITLFPIGNKVIVNVPYLTGAGASSYQYVMNTITGAWCRFTGWRALCWGLYLDKLLYGDPAGNVFQADVGTSDNGLSITADAMQAFNAFDTGNQKQFTSMRPVLNAANGITPACSINIDFDTTAPKPPSTSLVMTTLWGSPWNSPWSTQNGTVRLWRGASGIGYVGAPRIVLSARGAICKWQSTDVMFQECAPTL